MSKTFGVWKRKFKDKDGNIVERYFACPKTSKIYNENDFAEEISSRSSLTPGDVLGAISAISDLLKEKITTGNSVKLKGIGSFGMWVTSDGYENPKDINPKKVRATKITYKADPKLTQAIKEMKFDNMRKPPKGLVTKDSASEE